jgi:hypothetical protein
MKSPYNNSEYKASESEWGNFIQSNIWHDLQLFMVDRSEANRDKLEMTDEERLLVAQSGNGHYESADILRGRNREIMDLLNAPEAILQELQDMKEKESKDD